MKLVVAVPVRDEADWIVPCLLALDGQGEVRFDDIVLLINNSIDDTAALARAVHMHPGTRVHILERTLVPEEASAGTARRLAMEAAAAIAGPDGVLLTTDADSLVDPDWLAANLASLRSGADAVAGWVELHPVDWGAIPKRLHEDDARECAYDAMCDEIHGRLDPDPADPMPRHTHHSGASIAVTAAAFARCGGVPAVPCGEDRALIAALRRVDARVRHAPEVHVTVSGRLVGRAAGGMADTIRRRLDRPDDYLDDRLEPANVCARRASCRAELRLAWKDVGYDKTGLAGRLGLQPAELNELVVGDYFGAAWEAVEARAPTLRRKPVPVKNLYREMSAATTILNALRRSAGKAGPELTDPVY